MSSVIPLVLRWSIGDTSDERNKKINKMKEKQKNKRVRIIHRARRVKSFRRFLELPDDYVDMVLLDWLSPKEAMNATSCSRSMLTRIRRLSHLMTIRDFSSLPLKNRRFMCQAFVDLFGDGQPDNNAIRLDWLDSDDSRIVRGVNDEDHELSDWTPHQDCNETKREDTIYISKSIEVDASPGSLYVLDPDIDGDEMNLHFPASPVRDEVKEDDNKERDNKEERDMKEEEKKADGGVSRVSPAFNWFYFSKMHKTIRKHGTFIVQAAELAAMDATLETIRTMDGFVEVSHLAFILDSIPRSLIQAAIQKLHCLGIVAQSSSSPLRYRYQSTATPHSLPTVVSYSDLNGNPLLLLDRTNHLPAGGPVADEVEDDDEDEDEDEDMPELEDALMGPAVVIPPENQLLGQQLANTILQHHLAAFAAAPPTVGDYLNLLISSNPGMFMPG